MQFDRAKLKAAILYTCGASDPDKLGAVKLHKVLYFLDMIHFAQTGSPVTGATYRKRPFGPTCVPLLPILREMADAEQIEIRDVDFYGLRKKEYHALARPEGGLLNEPEVALLDEVIEFVCNQNSAKSISDYSHKLPWEMAEFGEEIPYHTSLLLFPVEVTPEAFEAAEEGLEEVAQARFEGDTVGFPVFADFRGRVLSEIGQARV
jgi:hypothetical protein